MKKSRRELVCTRTHRRRARILALSVPFCSLCLLSACGGSDEPAETDTQAPTVPGGLVAVVTTTRQINLFWSASTDDVGVSSYRVYRAGNLVATLGNTLQYASTGLVPGAAYAHAVQACDAAGNCSGLSTDAQATTPATLKNLNLGSTNLVIEATPVVGTNDAPRGGVSYTGVPLSFGPYIATGLPGPTAASPTGPLAAQTTLFVNGTASAAPTAVAQGDVVLLRVDFAAFAAARLAANGLPLPYHTQYLPSITAGAAFVGFGGPGSGGVPVGGIITCSDPSLPPSPGATRCGS